jgi:hypothetical protein
LFVLRQGRDILVVQVYVDDIVFGGSSNSLVARFAEDMSREFEMSMMGELQFFLGLQIKQSKEGSHSLPLSGSPNRFVTRHQRGTQKLANPKKYQRPKSGVCRKYLDMRLIFCRCEVLGDA